MPRTTASPTSGGSLDAIVMCGIATCRDCRSQSAAFDGVPGGSMTRFTRILWPCVLLLAIAGCGAREPPALPGAETPAPATGEPAVSVPAAAVVSGLPDFSPLVEAYGPAVVNVTTVAQREPASTGDPLYDFFQRFGCGAPHGPAPPVRGEGSGFLISADGYILTNAHVVDRAREVTVRMTDRREYRARGGGVDLRTD